MVGVVVVASDDKVGRLEAYGAVQNELMVNYILQLIKEE